MIRSNKNLLLGCAGFLSVCFLGALVLLVFAPSVIGLYAQRFTGEAFIEDPTEAARIGQEIVRYQLPPGYTEQNAIDVPFIDSRVVFIGPEARSGVGMSIVLMSFPGSLGFDEAEIRRQIEEAWSRQSNQDIFNLERVGSRQLTIDDQPVTFYTFEGDDGDGVTLRQVTGAFTSGETIRSVMIVGSTGTWDEEDVESFLNSLGAP